MRSWTRAPPDEEKRHKERLWPHTRLFLSGSGSRCVNLAAAFRGACLLFRPARGSGLQEAA